MNSYYVYAHICPETNVVKYIGKGLNERAYNFRNRHAYHRNWIKGLLNRSLFPIVKILHENLTETESFELEIFEIKRHREQGIILTNLTDGGDGIPGYTHKPETKKQQSKSAYLRAKREGIKGVGYDKRCPEKPWCARITVEKGKRKYLGYFATEEEARVAYLNELNNYV